MQEIPASDPDPKPQWATAASALAARFGDAPETAVVLGSGAGELQHRLAGDDPVPYPDVGLPGTGVAGHPGNIAVGNGAAGRMAALAGRVHYYEGRGTDISVCAVRALAAWGVRRLVLVSAVGGLRADLAPGSLVRITDHINLTGANPLMGPNVAALGPRFPDLADAYTAALGAQVDATAARLGVPLHTGVYAAVPGPSYETAAEVRMLAQLGGDVVGMSVVHEVIAAAHAGMQVLVVAVVANPACGLTHEALLHTDVTRVVSGALPGLGDLLCAALETP